MSLYRRWINRRWLGGGGGGVLAPPLEEVESWFYMSGGVLSGSSSPSGTGHPLSQTLTPSKEASRAGSVIWDRLSPLKLFKDGSPHGLVLALGDSTTRAGYHTHTCAHAQTHTHTHTHTHGVTIPPLHQQYIILTPKEVIKLGLLLFIHSAVTLIRFYDYIFDTCHQGADRGEESCLMSPGYWQAVDIGV